jgi:hypothetical protein
VSEVVVVRHPFCTAAAFLITLPITAFSLGLVVLRNLRPLHLPPTVDELTNMIAHMESVAAQRDSRRTAR